MYELVISSTPSDVVIALLKDKKLVELQKEPKNTKYVVGDIYLGKVRKVLPGLNAAFVDVGYEKDAFLHYFDLGPQFTSLSKYVENTRKGKEKTSNLLYFKRDKDISKEGSIDSLVKSGQELVVQVAKEPISTKGPRIGTEISIAGRFLVLVPFSDRISVSQKIPKTKEKERLKKLLRGIKPKNFGVIVRTNAIDVKSSELEADLKDLLKKWEVLYGNLKSAKPKDRVLGELSRTSTIVRDIVNNSFERIAVDDPVLYDEIKDYLQQVAPEKAKIVEYYDGQLPIFEKNKISKQIKNSFGKTATLSNGIYLVIEHTEACHVIDVNSGNRSQKGKSQEENALAVNIDAAQEIARQLRLRDMGGIIVVDFIDMRSSANRKLLFQKMKEFMKDDRAKHSITPPSKFGLIEITRQRVRPLTKMVNTEMCPSCQGSGKIEATINHIDILESKISTIDKSKQKKISIGLHPFLAAYMTKGMFSLRYKWQKKYGVKIKILSLYDNDILEHHVYNVKGQELNL
ncbi:MAG: ribonuclease G [Saprospiraceae bacterium]